MGLDVKHLRERATELFEEHNDIQIVCDIMNNEFEQFVFYLYQKPVKTQLMVDCSDWGCSNLIIL